MIRRDAIDEQGRPSWILIPQREHACLAGDLAVHWGSVPFSALPEPEVLVPAISRHDDGWASWDSAPDVNSVTGRPIDFMEMEVETADAIWSDSIASVADLGPLAQFTVARHFTALRERHAAESLAGARFVLDYHSRSERWLIQWQHENSLHTEEIAQQAVRCLQFFDGLSLWFCCGERTQTQSFTAPRGTKFEIVPRAGNWVVSPWPWRVPRVELAATGKRVPARKYASTVDLLGEPATEVNLRWTLVSG